MRGVTSFKGARPRVVRSASVMLALVVYGISFTPVHDVVGSAAFLVSLIPCIVGGWLLGVPGALGAIAATIVMDRSQALALGIAAGPELLAAIMAKLLVGLGAGVLTSHARKLRRLNAQLEEQFHGREAAESAAAKSRDRYRTLVESLGEGVGVFDANDRFFFANRELARLLKTAPEKLTGTSLADYVDDVSRERLVELRAGAKSTPRTYELTLRACPSRLLLITETELQSEGGSTLCVVRDLSERVQNEQRQRKLELELERGQALQSLAVLAGGVAHDFNNLLSGVVGNAEFALMRLKKDPPEKLAEYLQEIKAFSTEAAQLSRQMLAYAGRQSLAIAPMDLGSEIAAALRLSRSTVEPRARLELRLAADLPEVHADRHQFRQVLTNLVLNAAEAMGKERGTVTISTQRCPLNASELASRQAPSSAAPGDYVAVSVRDTGRGIPRSTQAHIFQPFFSTKSQGRGMGLAAASGIAQTHRGWLSVESESGAGACFTLWLPLQNSAPNKVASQRPSGVQASPCGRVLLIDDEPAVRLVAERLLSELGQDVMTADSGQAGLEVFIDEHSRIDLVVLDLTMPDLSGEEVLARLREIQPNVEVILTSGFQPSHSNELLEAPNVVGFLEKPHTLAGLRTALARRITRASGQASQVNAPTETPLRFLTPSE